MMLPNDSSKSLTLEHSISLHLRVRGIGKHTEALYDSMTVRWFAVGGATGVDRIACTKVLATEVQSTPYRAGYSKSLARVCGCLRMTQP